MRTITRTVEQRGSSKNNRARLLFVAVALFFQIIWVFGVMFVLRENYNWVSVLSTVLAVILVIGIYNSDEVANIKLPWIILILVFPIPGIFLYFMVNASGTTSYMRERFKLSIAKSGSYLERKTEAEAALMQADKEIYNISRYVWNYSSYPLYQNTDVEYFRDAALGIQKQMECMRRAKRFIFMAYFSIEDAQAFAEIYEILKEKIQEGVEVRLFYDDIGSAGFIDNRKFIKKMEAIGASCKVFNPVSHILNVFFNTRDHRKITVVDGEYAFTGGYNIADEYFNLVNPYGHWKDSGVMVRGEAVRSFTAIFLETWNASKGIDLALLDDSAYFPSVTYQAEEKIFAQVYGDSPLDDEQLAENVYMSLIQMAQDYIYIMTPYLIITDEMKSSLVLAAKRGVDVRIITPGIPDKKLVYGITRSFYGVLAQAGVKIYEYTPGFCHAKQLLVDDKAAVCGTINFDYRSLYLSFENAILFTCSKALFEMKKDFVESFDLCSYVTDKYANESGPRSLLNAFLRLFAPLM